MFSPECEEFVSDELDRLRTRDATSAREFVSRTVQDRIVRNMEESTKRTKRKEIEDSGCATTSNDDGATKRSCFVSLRRTDVDDRYAKNLPAGTKIYM